MGVADMIEQGLHRNDPKPEPEHPTIQVVSEPISEPEEGKKASKPDRFTK